MPKGLGLLVAAIGEGLTGLALLLAPSLVGMLLLGDALAGPGPSTAARVAGLALIGLPIASWTGSPALGMLLYSGAVMLLLAWLGAVGGGGVLLWPAVAAHIVLTGLLFRDRMRDRN